MTHPRVIYSPVRIAFELVILPWEMYVLAIGFALIPIVIMEIAKAVGLIKHHHDK